MNSCIQKAVDASHELTEVDLLQSVSGYPHPPKYQDQGTDIYSNPEIFIWALIDENSVLEYLHLPNLR